VPQKELYRYSTRVRSLTGGKGEHAEEFSHYEELPPEMEQKIVAEAKARKEAGNGHHL
jgi:elongation factor G